MSQQPDVRPHAVKNALTVDRLGTNTRTHRPATARKRRRGEAENDDFARFAVRIIRAHGWRIAAADVKGLAELLALRAELDAATQAAGPQRPIQHDPSWQETLGLPQTCPQSITTQESPSPLLALKVYERGELSVTLGISRQQVVHNDGP